MGGVGQEFILEFIEGQEFYVCPFKIRDELLGSVKGQIK